MVPASKRSESGGYKFPQQSGSPVFRLVETPDIVTSHGEGVWKPCLKLISPVGFSMLCSLTDSTRQRIGFVHQHK